MTTEKFWQTIEAARRRGSLDDALTTELKTLERNEISDFRQIYREYMRFAAKPLLMAACRLRNGWLSDDVFESFRSALVTQGKTAYFAALREPDMVAELAPREQYLTDEASMYASADAFEEMGYGDVYEAVAARRLPRDVLDSLKSELRYNPRIDAGYNAALRENLLPKLTARYEEIQVKFERREPSLPQPEYDAAELFGHPALFSYERVDRAALPDGLYAYDVRHDDN
ncbi:MAG: DUF4240 domain-containing protein, partial [Oscillospiraceae bacterium]|nr:DUF4240 domain-containing protein [Oscillospiraceae bacterium]